MRILIALLICTSGALAQSVYEIPFPEGTSASQGNTIELTVANSSDLAADNVRVELTNAPVWLKFEKMEIVLDQIQSKEERTAFFTFSVDKSALVNKEQMLSFMITDKTGQQWKKDLKVQITPPTTFELFQNYPNPFNPTTTIEYQLPGAGTRYFVSIKIYDLLGREVAHLVEEHQEPGGHQVLFNAQQYASGMYIYRLIATDNEKTQRTFQKRMMLIR